MPAVPQKPARVRQATTLHPTSATLPAQRLRQQPCIRRPQRFLHNDSGNDPASDVRNASCTATPATILHPTSATRTRFQLTPDRVRGCELLPGMHRNAVPLKCGCRNVENHRHIHRRGATELFRNPVRGAKRMRAGGSSLLVAGRLPTDGYDAADSTFLAKIFSVIYTTALRR